MKNSTKENIKKIQQIDAKVKIDTQDNVEGEASSGASQFKTLIFSNILLALISIIPIILTVVLNKKSCGFLNTLCLIFANPDLLFIGIIFCVSILINDSLKTNEVTIKKPTYLLLDILLMIIAMAGYVIVGRQEEGCNLLVVTFNVLLLLLLMIIPAVHLSKSLK